MRANPAERSHRPRSLAACAVALVTLVACSSTGTSSGGPASTGPGGQGAAGTTVASRPPVQRPDGPAADVSQELTAGSGVFLGASSAGPSLGSAGYVEHEYLATGTATSYRAPGGLPADGRFVLEEATEAPFRTRIVARRPAAPERFNGAVAVEWLNVSGGVDANPDYSFLAEELTRGGYAWVGVSAQAIGVEGGPVAVSVSAAGGLQGKGLKAIDPARYGSLQHPGDAYSFDMFTQVARALRAGGALGGLVPQRVLAVGESQSAFTLTTYVDGVQPRTKAFDGFLVHSRGGAAAPLAETGGTIDIASAIAGAPTIIRTDTDAPVIILESETDLVSIIGYYRARQDDSANIRLWEIAGTAHADRSLVGSLADSLDCGAPINDGPQGYVVRAALRSLDTWVRTGEAPPSAPRLEIDLVDAKPVIRRDPDGIALGGIRTPHVDVPVAALTGEPGSAAPSVICLLMGSTKPLSTERIVALHRDRKAYLDAFAKSTDAAIDAGFVLAEDRAAVLADAEPDRLPA